MTTALTRCVEVAVFAPLRRTFHYLPPASLSAPLALGALVKVPFGRGSRAGVVVGAEVDSALSPTRLRPVTQILGDETILAPELLRLARWAADYYQHPLGEVFATTLPSMIRSGRPPSPVQTVEWVATDDSAAAIETLERKAPRQAALLKLVVRQASSADDFLSLPFDWRRPLRELEKKGLVGHRLRAHAEGGARPPLTPVLNAAQAEACARIAESFGTFRVHLLHGVTGSGKTEVYMAAMASVLERGESALMLVPEIVLTEQLVIRLKQRFGGLVAVLHSGLSEAQRARVWQRAANGEVKLLMGTRSAVWAPLRNLGVIIVDEEHDSSLKQHDGFRYHARDVAIVRAQQLSIPIVLGSATPSLEAYHNVSLDKYNYLTLPERAGSALMPHMKCIDVRGLGLTGGLSEPLCRAIAERIDRGEQSILFLNRRGFAPVILCHQCGWIARCTRCDANLVWHKGRRTLICHHCGGQTRSEKLDPCCRTPELIPLGLGTEQIEEALKGLFPDRRIARVDRDSMRRKGAMTETFDAVRNGAIDILIGTQMLAKGHDFEAVTLVGIIDADSQLFSTDFRAEEKLAQLIVQVAGRAGRAQKPGEVLIQTHHPHHAVLRTLLTEGYDSFVERALAERRAASLPPFVPMALIRAESPDANSPLAFLRTLVETEKNRPGKSVQLYGPIPAAMEKRAGRYRAQVMISANTRHNLKACVRSIIARSETLSVRRNVRWSIDIDPQDTL